MKTVEVFQNTSKLHVNALAPILRFAKKTQGVRGRTFIKVTGLRYSRRAAGRIGGWAYKSTFTHRKFLKRINGPQWVLTRPGTITLRLSSPFDPEVTDVLGYCRKLLEVACHEFAHLRQYQDKLFLYSGGLPDRKRWADRPWEIDAENRTHDAIKRNQKRADDLVLELAITIEQIRRRHDYVSE